MGFFKVTRLGIALVVGALIVGGSGLTTYLILSSNEEPVVTPTPIPAEPKTTKEIFLSNLMSGSLNVTNMDIKVTNVVDADLNINFVGVLDYDIMALLSNDFSSLKGSGALTIKWNGINEAIGFSYTKDNLLYFSYGNKNYSVKTSTLLSLPNYLSMLGLDLSSVLNSFDLSNIMPAGIDDPMSLLSNMTETKNLDGYTYRMLIPGIGTIDLKSDLNGSLIGISSLNPIVVDNNLITIKASVTAKRLDDGYSHNELTNEVNSVDSLTNIFTTLGRLKDSGSFDGKFKVNLASSETIPEVNFNSINLEGSLKASLYVEDNIYDFENSLYELVVNPIKDSEPLINGVLNNQNSIAYLYKNNTSYFILNNLIKGQINNESAKDIFDTIEKQTDSTLVTDMLDEVDDIIKSTPIYDVINGDFTRVKDIVTNFVMVNNVAEISINQEMFGLGDNTFKVVLNLNGDAIKSISISNFKYRTFTLDFELELEEYTGYSGLFYDCENYQDFSKAKNIYDSIANLISSGQYNVSVNGSLSEGGEAIPFASNLKADISHFNPNNNDLWNSNLGEYALDFATTIDNKNHSITGALIENTIYAKYNDLKYSVENQTISDLFTWVDTKLGDSSLINIDSLKDNLDTTPFNNIMSGVDDTINNLANMISDIIEGARSGDLSIIDKYITIFNTHTSDSIKIGIKPYGDDTMLIVTIDSNNGEIRSIDIQNLRFNGYELSFMLTVNEFDGVYVSDAESYCKLDDLINGVTNFVDKQQYNMTIDASIYQPGKEDLFLSSNGLQVDLLNDEYYGSLTLRNHFIYDSRNPYNHNLEFDTVNKIDTASGDEYKDIQVLYNNRILANIGTHSIASTLDTFGVSSSAGDLMDLIGGIENDMPLMDIINGDFSLLSNKYIKDIHLDGDSLGLTLDLALFGMKGIVPLYIEYDSNGINVINIDNGVMNGTIINLTLTFNEFSEELKSNRLSLRDTTGFVAVNLDCLPTLIKLGVNLINHDTYYISGQFQIGFLASALISLIASGRSTYYFMLEASIKILSNGTVDTYIRLIPTGSNTSATSEMAFGNNAGYWGSETHIGPDGEVHIVTRSTARVMGGFLNLSHQGTRETVTAYKVSGEEFSKNMIDWLVRAVVGINYNATMDIAEMIIESAKGEPPLLLTYENMINEFTYNEGYLKVTLDLKNVLDLSNMVPGSFAALAKMAAHTGQIELWHDADNNLTRAKLQGHGTDGALITITILSISGFGINLRVYFDLNISNTISSSHLAAKETYVNGWNTNPNALALGYAYISGSSIAGANRTWTGDYNKEGTNRDPNQFRF